MKFTHYLLVNVIPEWVKLYINFKLLKTYLTISKQVKDLLIYAKKTKSAREYRIIKNQVMDNVLIVEKLERDNQMFIKNFSDEVEKVENFCLFKHNDLKQKLIKCQLQIKAMHYVNVDLKDKRGNLRRPKNQIFPDQITAIASTNKQIKQEESLLESNQEILLETFYRFYVESVQFQSFVVINNEAIRKILKKYKKQMIKGVRIQKDEKKNFGELLKRLNFTSMNNKLKGLLLEIESMMVANFYPLNPKECRYKLRKYQEDKKAKNKHVFAFGFFAGYMLVFIMILLFLRYEGYIDPMGDKVFNKVFPCFRGMILFITYYWFIALDVYGWNYFKINYKIYLGFNHHFSTTTEIIKRVSVLSTIFLLVFILYILQMENLSTVSSQLQFFDPNYLPIICWIIGIIYVFIPTQRSLNGQGRKWMYRMAYGALIGHFYKYESRFTFFTDQFVSMVTPLRDVDYTLCYYYNLFRYGNEPDDRECSYKYRISALLPSLIPYSLKCIQYVTRGRQKGKFWGTDEMWNFFKTLLAVQVGYLSFLARVFPVARLIWIPVAIISSLWQYWWDLKKDFLFFEPNSRNKFLRDDLGYNSPKIYYLIAFLNLILRGTWALSISPDMYIYFGVKSELFTLLVGFLEMSRRFMNNFLKIEKEHILNLRSLKTVMDFKYPFDQQVLKLEQHEVEDVKSQWSISTLNRESLEGMTQLAKEGDQNKIGKQSLTIEQIRNSTVEPIRSTKILNQSPKLERADHAQFRLTDIVSQQQILLRKNLIRSSTVDIHPVNMEVINLAKKQEKFQKKKTEQIQDENHKYKLIIKSLYANYNMLNK